MIGIVFQREQLASALASGKPKVSGDDVVEVGAVELTPSSVLAVYAEEPQGLPVALITSQGAQRDWLAWVRTYAPTLRPFTAYCRVLTADEYGEMAPVITRPIVDPLFSALVLGEAFATDRRLAARPTRSSAAAGFGTTLAWCLARANTTVPGVAAASIADRWVEARRLTKQRQRSTPVETVVVASEIVRTLAEGQQPKHSLAGSVLGALRATNDPSRAIQELPEEFASLAGEIASGVRTDRVELLENAAQGSVTRSVPNADFVLGFLTFLVAPGSLKFASLLSNLGGSSNSLVWYTLCSAAAAPQAFLSEAGGVGRRILRDLGTPWDPLARPEADISVVELAMLPAPRNAHITRRTESIMAIELTPGVEVLAGWGKDDERNPGELAEMEAALKQLQRVMKRLDRLDTRPGEQQSLLDLANDDDE